jgi:hypothetical protein
MTEEENEMTGQTGIPRLAAAGLLTAAISLTAAASAGAQAVTTATPNEPGKGTRLNWDVDGTPPPIAGRVPSSLTLSAPAGFVLNTKAVAKRCRPLQARLDECPAKSRIGSALMIIGVNKPSGPSDLPVDIKLYRGKSNKVLAVTFLAGVRVVPGTLDGGDGIALTFDPLPVPPVIPQVSYQFKRVTVNLGVSRKVTRKVRGSKKRRKVRLHLVRTPTECTTGTWATTAQLGFPDATTALLQAPAACSAG